MLIMAYIVALAKKGLLFNIQSYLYNFINTKIKISKY